MGVVKKFQNPAGGLNSAGRAHYKRTTGANLKPPAPNPKTPKDAALSSLDYYWEAWLYYNYNTDATKTPKERVAEAREARPMMITTYRKGEEAVTASAWDSVLKSRYL